MKHGLRRCRGRLLVTSRSPSRHALSGRPRATFAYQGRMHVRGVFQGSARSLLVMLSVGCGAASPAVAPPNDGRASVPLEATTEATRSSAGMAPAVAASVIAGGPVGSVLLTSEAQLYPSAEAARAVATEAKPLAPGRTFRGPYLVVSSADGVVRLRSAPVLADCAAPARVPNFGGSPSYVIDAYAPFTQLVARLGKALRVEHPDGSGALVRAGAPLRVFADGHGELLDASLDALVGPVPRARLALGLDPTFAAEPIAWSRPLTPLVCDPEPMTLAAWQQREAEQRAVAGAKANAERADAEYRACRARAVEAPPPPPRPTSGLGGLGLGPALTCETMRDDLLRRPPVAWTFGRGNQGSSAPYCRVEAPERDRRLTVKLPNGKTVLVAELAYAERVVVEPAANAGSYLVELSRTCGSVRVELPRDTLARGGGSGVGLGSWGTGKGSVVYPRKGSAVTWPDGSAAGVVSASGSVRRTELETQSDGRLCRAVSPFAARLCQSAADLCESPDCLPGS